jgi:hypothetical protein
LLGRDMPQGERECSFASPLSSNAKCLGLLHCLLDASFRYAQCWMICILPLPTAMPHLLESVLYLEDTRKIINAGIKTMIRTMLQILGKHEDQDPRLITGGDEEQKEPERLDRLEGMKDSEEEAEWWLRIIELGVLSFFQ